MDSSSYSRIYTQRRILDELSDDSSDKTGYRDSSSGWMIRLLARIYTQTDYHGRVIVLCPSSS